MSVLAQRHIHDLGTTPPQMSIKAKLCFAICECCGWIARVRRRSNPCNQTFKLYIGLRNVSLRNTLQFLVSAMDKRSYALRVASHNILLLTCYNLFTYLFPTILLQVSISASICCFNFSKLSNVRSGLMKS